MARFLGAFNDNLFKIVVSLLAVEAATGAEAGRNLSIVGIVFILPFLLFSGYASSAYVLSVVPEFLIRFSLWLLTHTVYRIRILGQEQVPARGPALLVCNHLSHADGFLVGACVQRFIRFMVYRPYFELPGANWLLKRMNAIPVSSEDRRDILRSIERARAELRAGHVVCIFAEGAISRTGNLQPFRHGFERIVRGLDVPVIPVHLGGVWGSVFSFTRGRFFWKWPERLLHPVTVTFGAPLQAPVTAAAARQAVLELGSAAPDARADGSGRRAWRQALDMRFAAKARRGWGRPCVADTTGRRLSRGRTLAAGVLVARWLMRHRVGERMVGVLLPSSVAAVLVNLGATLAGRVPVNLNFTSGAESMRQAMEQCAIRTVLTSRAFLSKAGLPAQPDQVFVEDLLRETGAGARLTAWLLARLAPLGWLKQACGGPRTAPDELATVIFSSGSTGAPKGVMLSHRNIGANIDALDQVFRISSGDCVVGVLPFFHSFGFTATFWFPLVAGFRAAYHPSPTDGKAIGELVQAHRATILISTPTFYNGYLRRCRAEEFASLRLALVGAEKLRGSLAAVFKQTYGLDLLEGYGCTEMAPVVGVNTPDVRDGAVCQTGTKPGTVGHPIPGVAAKVVDRDTFADLPTGSEGLLLVKGPNLMLGYLNQPDRTREAIRDGWYVTGDIAAIDEDGFIRITDRLARFSKIGGEMVPHGGVEERIAALIGEGASCVVTAVPDEARGERLVALYTDSDMSPARLWEALCRTELPRLWVPKREDLRVVQSLPVLGTGKLDLRAVRQLALDSAALVSSGERAAGR